MEENVIITHYISGLGNIDVVEDENGIRFFIFQKDGKERLRDTNVRRLLFNAGLNGPDTMKWLEWMDEYP